MAWLISIKLYAVNPQSKVTKYKVHKQQYIHSQTLRQNTKYINDSTYTNKQTLMKLQN